MTRLYAAAKFLRNVEGQSDVAKLLNNTSPQRLNNWEARGISNEGLLEAQELIGCDAIWLRDGKGEMARGSATAAPDLNDMAKLVSLYAQSTENGRIAILDLAHHAPKIAVVRKDSTTNNQSK